MNCPRCGHLVNENANFCGGCGLSMADILQHLARQEAAMQSVEIEDFDTTDFTADDEITPVDDYNTETDSNTTFSHDADFIQATENESQPPVYQYTPVATNYHGVITEENIVDTDIAPLSTSDYLWMMILGLLPVVGVFYLVYTAIGNKNQNKRSYARAVLLFTIFLLILPIVYFFGIMIGR